MTWVDRGEASLLALDAGEVYVAGRYHSLLYGRSETYQYAVAVVRKGGLPSLQPGMGLQALRGARACFPGVGALAGWVMPIHVLMQEGGLKIKDCNNHVKSAIEFFGDSCAPNSLKDMYNPIGDNSDNAGDIAFVRDTTIQHALLSHKILVGALQLGPSARRRRGHQQRILRGAAPELYGAPNPYNKLSNRTGDYRDAFSSTYQSSTTEQSRYPYSRDRFYGQSTDGDSRVSTISPFQPRVDGSGQPIELPFQLFLSNETTDLLLQDATINFRMLKEDQQMAKHILNNEFVGDQAERAVLGLRDCPVKRAVLCVTSDPEMDKCTKMRVSREGGARAPGLSREARRAVRHQRPRDGQVYQDESKYNELVGDQAERAVLGLRDCPVKRAVLCVTSDPEMDKCTKMRVSREGGVRAPGLSREARRAVRHQRPRDGQVYQDESKYNELVGDQAERAVLGLRDCPVKRAVLCVTSDPEMDKCTKMRVSREGGVRAPGLSREARRAVRHQRPRDGQVYQDESKYNELVGDQAERAVLGLRDCPVKRAVLCPQLVCWRGHSTRHCARAVAAGSCDLVLLDAADMLHAAQQHRLVPFMQEVTACCQHTDLTYLRGKNTCHTGVGMAAGWVYLLAYLVSNGWMRSYGCDGAHAAAEYFSKSCAPGALSSEYVDSGTVPHDNLCHLCHGASYRSASRLRPEVRCRRDASEPYYGHVGALRCMVEGGGEAAFVRHTAPAEVSSGRRAEWWARDLLSFDLQLLCPDGTRAKTHEYEHCNLGKVPGAVLVGRANHTELDTYANLLLYAQQFYGAVSSDEFSDVAVRLQTIPHRRRSAEIVAGPALIRAARIVSCDAPQAAYYIASDPKFLSHGYRNVAGQLML
ncbi:Lactotransferrin, partial [Operophtera brumata]